MVARKGSKHRKLALMTVAAKIARIVFGILQNPGPFSGDLVRPRHDAQGASPDQFCVADRKMLRRAKNCLARAGEILTGQELAADVQRLAAALDATLHRKD